MNNENRPALYRPSALVCFALCLLTLSVPLTADPDLWGHVFYGKHAWLSGGLPAENTFSYTAPGYPWINHEWLFEYLQYFAFNAAGGRGLVLLYALFISALLGSVGLVLFESGVSTWTWALYFLGLLRFLQRSQNVRPQIATFAFTGFFLALTISVLDNRAAPGRLLCLPLLMVLSVNLHGGFLVPLGTVGLAFAYSLFKALLTDSDKKETLVVRYLLFAVVFSLAACLLNPYGAGLVKWLLFTLSLPRPEISEWRSVSHYISEPFSIAFLGMLVFALILLARKGMRFPRFSTCCFLVFTVPALLHVRHMGLAWLAAIMALAGPIDELVNTFTLRAGRAGRAVFATALLLVAFSCILRTACFLRVHGLSVSVDPDKYACGAVDFLKRNRIEGNILCYFDWSQQVIWHCWPRCRVAVDGRYRTAYPLEVIKAANAFFSSSAGWDELLRDYDTTLVMMPRNSTVLGPLEELGTWSLVYRDGLASIYALRCRRNSRLISMAESGKLILPRVRSQYNWP